MNPPHLINKGVEVLENSWKKRDQGFLVKIRWDNPYRRVAYIVSDSFSYSAYYAPLIHEAVIISNQMFVWCCLQKCFLQKNT